MCPHCKNKCPEWITIKDDCFICNECAKKKFTPEECEKINQETDKMFDTIKAKFK